MLPHYDDPSFKSWTLLPCVIIQIASMCIDTIIRVFLRKISWRWLVRIFSNFRVDVLLYEVYSALQFLEIYFRSEVIVHRKFSNNNFICAIPQKFTKFSAMKDVMVFLVHLGQGNVRRFFWLSQEVDKIWVFQLFCFLIILSCLYTF